MTLEIYALDLDRHKHVAGLIWLKGMFDIYLSLRCFNTGTGVTTYSLNPGIVRTNITRYVWLQKPFWRPIIYLYLKAPLFKDAEYGAQTVIYCAVEKSLEYETGKYYRYSFKSFFLFFFVCFKNVIPHKLHDSIFFN
jgi:hypothetical protein